MKHGFSRWLTPLYGLVLTAFTAYILLDAFVIPRSYAVVQTRSTSSGTSAVSSAAEKSAEASSSSGSTKKSSPSSGSAAAAAQTTADSYTSDAMTIQISQERQNDTTIYVADIVLKDTGALQTAFAQNTYGKNITAAVSDIAQQAGAVLAINGDYYSARSGCVIRNGVIYRDTSGSASQQDLVIDGKGNFSIVTENSVTAQQLLDNGAQQVLSFGPALVENGKIAVNAGDEVDKARTSNPRTAIGQIGEGHYVMVVADGRTSESSGLSLYQLAQFMQSLGVKTAYNLDGGGSSTMVFNGTVINEPTTNGRSIQERKVSDIVYVG